MSSMKIDSNQTCIDFGCKVQIQTKGTEKTNKTHLVHLTLQQIMNSVHVPVPLTVSQSVNKGPVTPVYLIKNLLMCTTHPIGE